MVRHAMDKPKRAVRNQATPCCKTKVTPQELVEALERNLSKVEAACQAFDEMQTVSPQLMGLAVRSK